MKKKAFALIIAGLALALVGCGTHVRAVRVETATIPDRTYEVTVHDSQSLSYAVLFDIPDDGKRVDLFYTYSTLRVGLDTPGKYIDRFNNRIRNYSTFQINDIDGTVRGYLMISNLLGYLIYERPKGERIIVMIDDPHHDDGGVFRRIPQGQAPKAPRLYGEELTKCLIG